jgi:hypothetical protein
MTGMIRADNKLAALSAIGAVRRFVNHGLVRGRVSEDQSMAESNCRFRLASKTPAMITAPHGADGPDSTARRSHFVVLQTLHQQIRRNVIYARGLYANQLARPDGLGREVVRDDGAVYRHDRQVCARRCDSMNCRGPWPRHTQQPVSPGCMCRAPQRRWPVLRRHDAI